MRNICAHHGRLWNRELGDRLTIPQHDSRWHEPVEVSNNRVFAILTILKYLLENNLPRSGWSRRLEKLFCEYPEIPRFSMGYPDGWEHCPIWNAQTDNCYSGTAQEFVVRCPDSSRI